MIRVIQGARIYSQRYEHLLTYPVRVVGFALSSTRVNLEAQSPDMFLTNLFYLDPDFMADITVRQADDYYVRPMTVSELLDLLSKRVPTFAQLVRNQLAPRP